MLRKTVLAAALLYTAELALADWDQFYFPANATTGRCQDGGNACSPPYVCVHEAVTDAHYCCASGQKDAVCWINSKDCRGEDSPDGKKAAAGQTACPTNKSPYGYCCRSEREQCTQRSGQINICWSTADNPIAAIAQDRVNDTFTSLLSASPSAKTLTVDIKELSSTSSSSAPATNSPSASSPSSSSQPANVGPISGAAPSSSTSQPTSSPTASQDSSSAISGGAIGGIVVGAVGGIALVGAGIFLLLRRRRSTKSTASSKLDPSTPSHLDHDPARPAEMDSTNPYANSAHAYSRVAQADGLHSPSAKYAHVAEAGGEAGYPHGGGAWNHPVEMPAETAQELDAGKVSPSRSRA